MENTKAQDLLKLGHLVHTRRKAARWSRGTLAAKLGVSETTVKNLENGRHAPLRLVRHAYLLAQDNPVSFILQTQRSMLQDCGVEDPDAAARAMQSEPWWPALYAAEEAYLDAF